MAQTCTIHQTTALTRGGSTEANKTGHHKTSTLITALRLTTYLGHMNDFRTVEFGPTRCATRTSVCQTTLTVHHLSCPVDTDEDNVGKTAVAKEALATRRPTQILVAMVRLCHSQLVAMVRVCRSQPVAMVRVCHSHPVPIVRVCHSHPVPLVRVCHSHPVAMVRVCCRHLVAMVRVCCSHPVAMVTVCYSRPVAMVRVCLRHLVAMVRVCHSHPVPIVRVCHSHPVAYKTGGNKNYAFMYFCCVCNV